MTNSLLPRLASCFVPAGASVGTALEWQRLGRNPPTREYTVTTLRGGFIRIDVIDGPYIGRSAVVATFPAEAAYYNALRGKSPDEVFALAHSR